MAGGGKPILVIKRPKKVTQGGHHGGQWKVAYADFVTAMMAFFLLLWLLNSVTEEQLEGISNYFAPISTRSTSSGSGGILGGRTVVVDQEARDSGSEPTNKIGPDAATQSFEQRGTGEVPPTAEPSEAELEEMLAEREEKQFAEAQRRLQQALDATPELKALSDHLLVIRSPEGLNIQITDRAGRPMFPRGSADMHGHTRSLLTLVANVVRQMPQDLAITGHTDATPFASDQHYGNWELSADRANAARRVLVDFGVPAARVSRVVGKAATDPLNADDPTAPVNRRLSVVLLRASKSDSSASSSGEASISVPVSVPEP